MCYYLRLMLYHVIIGAFGLLILAAVVGDMFGGRKRHNRREATRSDPNPYTPAWKSVGLLVAILAIVIASTALPTSWQIALWLVAAVGAGWLWARR